MKRNIVLGSHIGTAVGVLPGSARVALDADDANAKSLLRGPSRAHEINIQEHQPAVRYGSGAPICLSDSCFARYGLEKSHHGKDSVLPAADERGPFFFSPANVGCNIPVGVGIADTCVLSVGARA